MLAFPISMDPDFLLNEQQVSELTGIPVRTLQSWRLRGGGPIVTKLGKLVRYRRRDLSAWMDQNAIASTSELAARASA